ncbi:hypothetical protein G7046_g6445 [Stylonectria norvegica]|nr:hypothetical protein G7046_g6445 [Stylonectria norvegica]
MDDIAVVGIGLRFPGNATCPEELWKVLEREESQWSEFPKDRLNIDGYFHPGGDRQGSISFRGAHFIKEDFAAFDAPFFSVAAEDAKAIDPQQRFLLEASYEALENAGIRKEDIDGSDTAVYVGSFVKDYEQVCLRDPDWQPQYAATGNGIAIMANRISYFFNLHGPSMTLDTGCSGSLVSIHLAAQSLRTGECSLAIAAGAGMILTPNTIMPMTALNFLSPDGKCFTFDSRANGYGRGEGIGVVILKRLSDALRDNDTIRAVIRGTKVNQDGHTTGITLPSKEAQVANITSLYESAGLDFNQTAYVECHGTGTQAGDWRELKAISETLASVRSADNPIAVGSVKPNIGHLEGAAGVAGFIKGVLTLEHGKIPANINFETANPDIDFEAWKVKVPRTMMDWPLAGLRRVSVNCFGFGGTNAHVVIDEAPRYLSARGLRGNHNSLEDMTSTNESRLSNKESNDAEMKMFPFEPQIFCYSSHEKSGVRRVIDSHVPYLNSQDESSDTFLQDYAYTLGSRRSNLEWKHVIVAKSLTELISKIQDSDEASFRRGGKHPKLCFVFSGQGAQFAQMGKDLLPFEAFRDSLEAAAAYMKNILGSPFDLIEEILKGANDSRISDPEISQPATTALQVALVDLLDSFLILPKYVIGHSSGEVAAAFASGLISREAAWEVAYYRGLAASKISAKAPGLTGAMMVVGKSLAETKSYIEASGQAVEIACVNSHRSITVSGTSDAIEHLSKNLTDNKVFWRILPVKTAYHSSHMKLVEAYYQAMIHGVATGKAPPTATMFSTVTGEVVDASNMDNSYWVKNMVSPVQYVSAVQSMMSLPVEERPDIIIELSPVAALKSPTLDILTDTGSKLIPAYHSILERKCHSAVSLLEVVGELWVRGCPINMKSVVSRGSYQVPLKSLVDLPPYPWNHTKSYWHESHLGRANRFREFGRQDLIGAPTADAISFEPRWRGFLRISENPWIQDHQVQKTIIYPAAGMVTMALEGASQLTKDKSNLLGYEITNMRIDKAMLIPGTAHGLETAMNFKQISESSASSGNDACFEFAVYSKQLDAPWEQHATGSLQVRRKHKDWQTTFRHHEAQFKTLEASCTESMVPRQLYELLDIVGMNYGSLFQNITHVSKGGNSCISKVRVPDTKSKMPAKFEYDHIIHPATLDSMFQTLFAIDNEPMVPTYINSLFVSANVSREIGSEFTGYATANRTGMRDAIANIAMTQSGWEQPSVVIDGLLFTGLSSSTPGMGGFLPNHRNLCTEVIWEEDATFSKIDDLDRLIMLLAHKFPGLSILQIGGPASLAEEHLALLMPGADQTPLLSRYTIANGQRDEPALEVLAHVKGGPMEAFVETRAIDGSEPLPEYHLILAIDTCGIKVANLRTHLKPLGLLMEPSSPSDRVPKCSFADYLSKTFGFLKYHEPPTEDSQADFGVVILLPDSSSLEGSTFSGVSKLMSSLHHANFTVSCLFAKDALKEIEYIKGKVVVSFLEYAKAGPSTSVFWWSQSGFETFRAVHAAAKGLLCITDSAHMKPKNPTNSPVIALARTLMSEDPLKTVATLDIGANTNLGNDRSVEMVFAVFNDVFVTNHGSAPRELEFAEEDGVIFIPRLVPINALNKLVENEQSQATVTTPFYNYDTRLKLETTIPGAGDGGLTFSTVENSGPKSGEVEIFFERAPLTHADLEVMRGRTTESNLGIEVAGCVVQLGDESSAFQKGDRVAALVSGGAFQNTMNVDERFVKKWSLNTPLSHFVSAYHALVKIGRLSRGRSVLIHAGASCFGLAAIKMASELGLRIFASVMGPDTLEQRQALINCGVEEDDILEADSDSFVRVIQGLTGGKGVDVVYNSTQQHIEANFNCVRKSGTIIQFSSKSPCPPTIRMASSTASLVNLDITQLLTEDQDYMAQLLQETVDFVEHAKSSFAADSKLMKFSMIPSFEQAFALVEKSPYLGFTSMIGDPSSMVRMVAPTLTKSLHEAISKDETYLLAGGLGGLGRSICELLVINGARHVAFLSRSGASSEVSRAFIEGLKQQGVDARVYRADICDSQALSKVVKEEISVEMPPIRGVFQCAAVIKDAVFDNMTYSDWVTAMHPKTHGSQNLMDIIPSDKHSPFFIFLASSAGVIGNRGQANYAAGNCFEDALARNYRLQGKHAVAIDLGPVLGAGMLAEDEEILDMLRASGFYGIRHQDFLTMVKHAITMEISPDVPMPPQIIMGIGTGGLIQQNQPADPYWTRTALYTYLNLVDMPPRDLSVINSSASLDMKSMLASSAEAESAAEIVSTGLTHMLAKAMNMLPEEVDAGKPANVYGVDSLVAVGVRNWVLSNTGVEVSVFEVLSDKTVAELAADIAAKGGYGDDKK